MTRPTVKETQRRLAGWLKVRPGEGRVLLPVLVMTFAMAAGGSVGGNAVEALLFTRFGTQYLPQLYIGLGLLNVLAAIAGSAIIARGHRRRVYVPLPFAM